MRTHDRPLYFARVLSFPFSNAVAPNRTKPKFATCLLVCQISSSTIRGLRFPPVLGPQNCLRLIISRRYRRKYLRKERRYRQRDEILLSTYGPPPYILPKFRELCPNRRLRLHKSESSIDLDTMTSRRVKEAVTSFILVV